MMNGWKKTGAFLSTIALASAALAGCGTSNNTGNAAAGTSKGEQDKNITIGYVTWAEDVATSYLWQDLLQKKGYNVTLQNVQPGPLFVSLSKQGGVDVFLDTWLPITHKQYMDEYGSNLTDLGKWYQGSTKVGLVVPQYVYNSGIKSISDLNKNASKFNNQIIGISPGSGEMQTLKNKVMKDYGLNLSVVDGSEAAMLSALQKDENSKSDIVVTLWSPHWAFSKWKLDYLKDPKGAFGSAGWIQTEANTVWVKDHPTVAKWLKNFKLTPNQLGTLEQDVNNASTKQAGVQKWEKANQSQVNSWFK